MPEIDDSIWVETMVAAATGEPIVTLRWYDHSGQLTPAEARAFAAQVMAAADAAESDAFLFDFMKNKIGADKNDAGNIVVEFRKWREEHSS